LALLVALFYEEITGQSTGSIYENRKIDRKTHRVSKERYLYLNRYSERVSGIRKGKDMGKEFVGQIR